MKYFFSKKWGLSASESPFLGFNHEGSRKTFLNEHETGDWILIGATFNEMAEEEDQGRLLGKIRVGRVSVESEPILNSLGVSLSKEMYDDNGYFRWPYGLPMIEAYEFVDKPLITDIFNTSVNDQVWANQTRLLSLAKDLPANYEERIESLNTKKLEIVRTPELDKAIKQNKLLSRSNGSTGPGPSDSREDAEIGEGSPVTYWLKLEGVKPRQAYKIGYTNNLERRLKELNSPMVSSITKNKWVVVRAQPQDSKKEAFDCEQIIIKKLNSYLVENENEVFETSFKTILSIWNNAIINVDYI